MIKSLSAFVCTGLLIGSAACGFADDINPANKTLAADSTSASAPPSSGAGSYASDMSTSKNWAGARYRHYGLSKADVVFLHKANQGGLLEIETGSFASDNGNRYATRKLARRIVADHKTLNAQAGAFAQSHGVTLPATPDAKTQHKIAWIESRKGTGFDGAYLAELKKCHQMDIMAFEKEAATTSNADLRGWVQGALPTLRDHLQRIESLLADLNK